MNYNDPMNPWNGNNMNRSKIVRTPSAMIRKASRQVLRGSWKKMSIITLIVMAVYTIPTLIIQGAGMKNVSSLDMAKWLEEGNYEAINSMNAGSSLSNIFALLIMGPLMISLTMVFIRLVNMRNSDNITYSMAFDGFKIYGRSLGLYLYMFLFTFLWSLLFVIPGIIAALRYSQAPYIMVEHPEKSIPECVNDSKTMMNGNKMKLFCLDLSFIGWFILATIPSMIASSVIAAIMNTTGMKMSMMAEMLILSVFSIGTVVVTAYMMTADTILYKMITGQLIIDSGAHDYGRSPQDQYYYNSGFRGYQGAPYDQDHQGPGYGEYPEQRREEYPYPGREDVYEDQSSGNYDGYPEDHNQPEQGYLDMPGSPSGSEDQPAHQEYLDDPDRHEQEYLDMPETSNEYEDHIEDRIADLTESEDTVDPVEVQTEDSFAEPVADQTEDSFAEPVADQVEDHVNDPVGSKAEYLANDPVEDQISDPAADKESIPQDESYISQDETYIPQDSSDNTYPDDFSLDDQDDADK